MRKEFRSHATGFSREANKILLYSLVDISFLDKLLAPFKDATSRAGGKEISIISESKLES